MPRWTVIFTREHSSVHAFSHVEAESVTDAIAQTKSRLPDNRGAITGVHAEAEESVVWEVCLSDDEALSNARADPDNPPLTDEQLARMKRKPR